jgi:hypothetical protein
MYLTGGCWSFLRSRALFTHQEIIDSLPSVASLPSFLPLSHLVVVLSHWISLALPVLVLLSLVSSLLFEKKEHTSITRGSVPSRGGALRLVISVLSHLSILRATT